MVTLVQPHEQAPPRARPDLTRQELAVVRLVADGNKNDAIALKLGITSATVKTYLTTVMDKWGLRNRTEVAVRAYLLGLLRTDG